MAVSTEPGFDDAFTQTATEKPKADKAPKKPGRPKGSKNSAKDKAKLSDLEGKLAGFLTGPALAFQGIGEDWPADHTEKQAPNLAHEIVAYAGRNDLFRQRLEAFMEGGQTTALIVAGGMYLLPLLIYFNILPAPIRIRMMLQIPQRGGTQTVAPNAEEIPPAMREEMTAAAIRAGFVDEVGNADLDAYMKAGVEAMQNVRAEA